MSGQVIAFPVDRQTVLVRQTVDQLRRRHGVQADKFWKTEVRRLYARLQVQGFGDEQIRHQIDRFSLAVIAGLERLEAAERRARADHDGGAA